jgi:hypothetical protein
MAATAWPSNADLIADCFELGYLHEDWLTLDPTYGEGVFWRKRRPTNLVTSDIVPGKADMVADFTALPFADHTFQAVVYDPNCTRVLAPKGYLLVKCQNQVCSGKVRWQVDAMSAVAEREGLEKVDQLEYLNTPRPQPGDRRQVHARRNHSTLLVFRKP